MAGRQSESQPVYTICRDEMKYKPPLIEETCIINTCADLGFTRKERLRFQYISEKENEYKRNTDYILHLRKVSQEHKPVEVIGKDRHKYFRRPIIPFLSPKEEPLEMPTHFAYEPLDNVIRSAQRQCYILSSRSETYKNVSTQTDYRESEAQTVPWEPPYKIRPGHNPEVLTLAHLTWDHGLPAGMHELEIINRMRMKRAWEAILPPMDTPANVKMRKSIITALEIDEWAFRESEIQLIMDLRLSLLKEMSETREYEQDKKKRGRFNRLKENLEKRRDKEINSIRHNLRRQLRNLRKKYYDKQSQKRDIVKLHADPASELYAPQMRYGEHPQRRHEVLEKVKGNYIDSIYAKEEDTTPTWLPTYEELKAIKPKPKPTDLCIRETRWTEEKLKQLHLDLKAIRLNLKPIETSNLMKRKYKTPSLPSTPFKTSTRSSEQDSIEQSSIFIQKIIRGRATQWMMYEGRNRCRELIEELQSTYALEGYGKVERQKEKMQMLELQRIQNRRSMQEDRLCEILNSLEGKTVSGMLDYLSKELVRLQEERKAHAFALLAEREKATREAAEASRREIECNRRRECDEMFRQIIKATQDSVETYLEDIIKENIEWMSDKEAKEYILELSNKADEISKCASENATQLEQDEMVADMIYNFVLPEVQKNNIRQGIKEKQQSYLKAAHTAIYESIMNLPPVEHSEASGEIGEEVYIKEDFGEGSSTDNEMTRLFITENDRQEKECEVKDSGDITEAVDLVISKEVKAENEEVVQGLLDFIISEAVEHVELVSLEIYDSSSTNDDPTQ